MLSSCHCCLLSIAWWVSASASIALIHGCQCSGGLSCPSSLDALTATLTALMPAVQLVRGAARAGPGPGHHFKLIACSSLACCEVLWACTLHQSTVCHRPSVAHQALAAIQESSPLLKMAASPVLYPDGSKRGASISAAWAQPPSTVRQSLCIPGPSSLANS